MHERYSSDNAMSSSDQESNVIIMDSQGLLKSPKKLSGLYIGCFATNHVNKKYTETSL